ncbi:Zn-dependent hydrolase [Vibrio alfacsensis]|uniref:allantoate deiminase n=1 Tax=Vibrio alfacsensis TaxID=1074311 RepID=UPI001BEE6339|nr:allantoate deiminase [Vibrio alfacsensis]WQE75614.1 allantoate deiminase [Vibrio alfacsensis]BBM63957.1 Zn-dependent hydrolase [Vibrio alfacsensis]
MELIKEQVTSVSNEITKFGYTDGQGMTRLLYTSEWLSAQKKLLEIFEKNGLQVYSDDIGNAYGRLEGTEFPNEVILSGSHIDTVVNGGNLDGQYGIEAAFIAINYLKNKHGSPRRTLEVISLVEEEGSRFPYVFWGSKNIVGLAKNEDVMDLVDKQGVRFVDAMRGCGFDFASKKTVRKDIKAFIELHIEQGKVLETEGKQLGVVTGIVGQRRYDITLKGEANHAGTTPMGYRKDTVYAFSKICSQSIEKAQLHGDPLVLTFGKVEPKPNTVNVVPGEILFTMDCRHTDKEQLVNFSDEIVGDIKRIAEEMGMECDIDLWMDESPVPMDSSLIDLIDTTCAQNGANYRVMHSGAGHDAQIFAPVVPTGMIFVPSIGGISHNPAEKTDLDELCAGVKALADVLYELAYK